MLLTSYFYRVCAALVLSALVAGCGGGDDDGGPVSGGGGSSGAGNPSPTFSLGGTISGLASGQSVTLQNNGSADLTVSANGTFTFAQTIAGNYGVTVLRQPAGQTCTVSNGTGTATTNITNITVSCVGNTTPIDPGNPGGGCLSRYAAITVNMTESQVLAILGPATSRTPAVGNVLGLGWEAVSYQSGEVCDVIVGMDRNGAYTKGADVRDDGIAGVSEVIREFVPY